MKRADDVFFFTLVDFLLQAFFFGLLVYVLNATHQAHAEVEKKAAEKSIEDLKRVTGVSNLTELLDILTKLAPVDRLMGWADFFARNGGLDKVNSSLDAVNKAGGPEKLAEGMERLRKFEEGSGKPPCLYDAVGDKKVARNLATVVGDDSSITFQGTNEKLEEVLQLLGTNYKAVEKLSLADFKRTFGILPQKRPDCRYTLLLIEETRFVDARDAADVAFYTQKRPRNAQPRPRP